MAMQAQAGRGDLRYAVQLHRHLDLAEALGVRPSSRGGHYKLKPAAAAHELLTPTATPAS